jgi:hypothetical protein
MSFDRRLKCVDERADSAMLTARPVQLNQRIFSAGASWPWLTGQYPWVLSEFGIRTLPPPGYYRTPAALVSLPPALGTRQMYTLATLIDRGGGSS